MDSDDSTQTVFKTKSSFHDSENENPDELLNIEPNLQHRTASPQFLISRPRSTRLYFHHSRPFISFEFLKHVPPFFPQYTYCNGEKAARRALPVDEPDFHGFLINKLTNALDLKYFTNKGLNQNGLLIFPTHLSNP